MYILLVGFVEEVKENTALELCMPILPLSCI